MKVLQINCVYPKGSTGKIVRDLHNDIRKRGMQSVVCYGRGEKSGEPGVYKTCSEPIAKANNLLSRVTGLMYGGCLFPTQRLQARIKKEKPDVVHVHCINGYFVNIYRFITWLKKQGIPTVITLHAEFMHTGNCGYAFECERWKTGCGNCPRCKRETKSFFLDGTHASWEKMREAFAGFERLTLASVSPWLMERAKVSPILAGKRHVTVLNGIDTQVFCPDGEAVEALRREHGLEGKQIVFHATASLSTAKDHIKGGYYVLELARRLEGENTVFLIAAGACEENIKFPSNVIFLGRISDQRRLAHYYALGDVTLLTSKKETFSMPVAESLCCGTPVVGFEAGAPEMIALPRYSRFLPYGDTDALEAALREALKVQKDPALPELAREVYRKEKMLEEYCKLYADT